MGIVPDHLLAIVYKNPIHIHPGFLPDVRWADCVLWSQLLANRPSTTAFYLAPGIIIGDLLYSAWLPSMRLNFPSGVDIQVKCQLIYDFFGSLG